MRNKIYILFYKKKKNAFESKKNNLNSFGGVDFGLQNFETLKSQKMAIYSQILKSSRFLSWCPTLVRREEKHSDSGNENHLCLSHTVYYIYFVCLVWFGDCHMVVLLRLPSPTAQDACTCQTDEL